MTLTLASTALSTFLRLHRSPAASLPIIRTTAAAMSPPPAATMSTTSAASAAITRDNSRPLVLSGPSGSGKSTLLTRLFKEFPNAFGFSVSHTSRSPRPGEVNGVNYNYVTRPEFEALIHQGVFIEHAEFAKNLYGTSVLGVKQVIDQGRVCVLDIDMQGVKLIKQTPLHPWFIFIQPPSMDALEARLRGRGTEKEEAIADRLETARLELEYAKQPGAHDLVLVNDDLEDTYRRLVAWIQERYAI